MDVFDATSIDHARRNKSSGNKLLEPGGCEGVDFVVEGIGGQTPSSAATAATHARSSACSRWAAVAKDLHGGLSIRITFGAGWRKAAAINAALELPTIAITRFSAIPASYFNLNVKPATQ
ncbi:hypothetical protein VH566_11805 [Rhizobium wenxiniae]